MMKKIFLFVIGFVMFKVGYSQYPIQQYIGADSAVVTSKGGLQGRLINQVFVDTTAANSQRIKQYPGAMIYASGKLWVRNTTATKWTELAYGPISTTNIYNSDGTLTGNRQLDGDGYSLTFNNIGGEFGVGADSINLNATSGKLRMNLNSGVGTKALRYNPVTKLLSYADTTSSLTGYVPYTGATQNVDLGQYGLKTEYVEFDTTLRAVTDRTLSWNNDDGTLNLGMVNGGSLTQKIGLQQFARVKNVDTVAISKGQAVYIYGASGDRASVKLAVNKGDATSSKTLGVAAENIPINGVGFVGTFGTISNLNLGAYTAGNILYLDSIPGQLTATKPQAPYHIVFVGVVERANAGNGLLFVNPQNGYELDELHNVRITSPVPNKALLIYDSTSSLWVDTTFTAAGLGVYSVATNTGTGITGGTITTTGTLAIDTNLVSTRAWRQKGIDSVASLANSKIGGSGTTNYVPKFTASGTIGNSQIFDNGTNVGIGTASPSSTLELYKSSGPNYLYLTNGTSGTNNGVVLRYNSVDYMGMIGTFTTGELKIGGFNASGYFMTFYSNNAERMRIFASTGNVAIGTTTDAGYKLDVSGTFRSTGDAYFATSSGSVGIGFTSTAFNTVLQVKGPSATPNNGIILTTNTWTSLSAGTGVRIGTGATSGNTYGVIDVLQTGGLLANGALSIAPQGGSVLIGTTTDAGLKLDVSGTLRSTTSAYFATSSGNVGIGNTSPAAKLDVTAANGEIRSTGTAASYTQYNAFITSGVNMRIGAYATNNGYLGTTTNHPFAIETNNTERARFTSGGNVLIGTTTDAGYKLDVSGTLRSTQGANFATSSGNVGILTTSPTNLLTLVGSTTGRGIDFVSQANFALVTGKINYETTNDLFSIINTSTWGNSALIFGTSNTERARFSVNGNFLIGTTTDAASAILNVSSTTKGFLPPRMTTTQKNAITTPATGLVVFDTTLAKLCVYTGSAWETITSL